MQKLGFAQYLSALRTLWKVTDSSKTVSMYTSSTMAWSSCLKKVKVEGKAASTKIAFILLLIVYDEETVT